MLSLSQFGPGELDALRSDICRIAKIPPGSRHDLVLQVLIEGFNKHRQVSSETLFRRCIEADYTPERAREAEEAWRPGMPREPRPFDEDAKGLTRTTLYQVRQRLEIYNGAGERKFRGAQVILAKEKGYLLRFCEPSDIIQADTPLDSGEPGDGELALSGDLKPTTSRASPFAGPKAADPDDLRPGPKIEARKLAVAATQDRVSDVDQIVRELRAKTRAGIEDRCGKLRVLNTDSRLELDAVYTEVHVLANRPGNLRQSLDELARQAKVDSLDRFGIPHDRVRRINALKAFDLDHRVIVYGQPGSGKTTFLKRLAVGCARGEFHPELVPVFITFGEFARSRSVAPTLAVQIERAWAGDASTRTILEAGRALILLDGLDEVSGMDLVFVRESLERFTQTFHRCTIALTCRVAALESTLQSFSEVEIADFDWPQTQGFVRRWFRAQGKQLQASALIRGIRYSPNYNNQAFGAASRPLFLTLLCLVFRDRGKLHDTEAELYQDCVDLLIQGWDSHQHVKRRRPYHLSGMDMEALLEEIAFSGMLASERVFSQLQLEHLVKEYLGRTKRTSPTQTFDARRVLNSIESHLGILIQRSVGVYAFSHLTFQEYFTARYLTKKTELLLRVGPKVGDRQWRQVWLFLAAMARTSLIVDELKKQTDMLVANEPEIQRFLKWCCDSLAQHDIDNSLGARAILLANVFALIPNTSHLSLTAIMIAPQRSRSRRHGTGKDRPIPGSIRQTFASAAEPGRDWRFSAKQVELLDAYCAAHLVLMRGMDLVRGLNRQQRAHIENTLLLPGPEAAV
ncbi:MAG TPA: NACHT domain-containing protein [Bryobacteraceae bacterium]|jgi:hypothetical protein